MRYARRAMVVLLVCAVGAITQLPTAALENPNNNLSPPTRYVNGPNGPLIFVIGDSISADATQQDVYAYINGSLGWKTQIEAVGGSNITDHERFDSFTHARNSNAKAVYVELGTNDIGLINHDLSDAQILIEIDKVFQAVNRAVAALGDTCVVWVGLNEQWDATFPNQLVYDDADVAAAFNDHVQSLLPSHPNLHYADYDAYVQQNATFRNSLLADVVQIHPTTFEGKVELGNFEAWYSELYC
jgi:GDSL-like Lipase/Acylhydrolase family